MKRFAPGGEMGVNLKLTSKRRPCLTLLFCPGVRGPCCYPHVLHRIWGCRLRSPCLEGRRLPTEPLPATAFHEEEGQEEEGEEQET